MSLFAAYHSGAPQTYAALCDQLAGNLCRCTGYRPIIAAALADLRRRARRPVRRDGRERAAALAALADDADLFVGDEAAFFAAPASLDSLAALYARFPDATLVGGATDVGLWITKQLRDLKRVIWLGRVAGLDGVRQSADGAVSLGAALTLGGRRAAARRDPSRLGELMRRFGSKQVRASGTVGGNIANGSPIGDLAPALIALGGRVVLRKGDDDRARCRWRTSSSPTASRIAAPGEFVAGGRGAAACGRPALPRLQGVQTLRRGHFRRHAGGPHRRRRAADRRRARSPVAAWRRRRNAPRTPSGRWSARASTSPRAGARRCAALSQDFAPLTDQRASAAYRMTVAANLLEKALHRNLRRERADPDRRCSMPPNDAADLALATAVVHKPLPHDSARLHVQGAATYVDDIREPAGTLHIAIGMADKACGRLKGLDLDAVRAAPGVVAVLTAADIPGKNDIAPVFADEPLFADEEVMFHGQALFAVVARTRDEARRAARLAKIDIEAKTPAVTIADALVDRRAGAGRLRLRARRRGRRDRQGGASAGGPVRDRRPGAFLSRGPGVVRHSRRRRRDDGARLDAGPDRDAAHRRARPRHTGRVRHRRDAAHGRRLRRQGEPGLRLGGDRGARRARHRPSVQDPPRPRRRFHADRQAPRFPRRLARRLRRPGRRRRLRRDAQRALRLLGRPLARRLSTARCFTPATATGCPTSRSPRAASRPTPSPTPPFAASAARRA